LFFVLWKHRPALTIWSKSKLSRYTPCTDSHLELCEWVKVQAQAIRTSLLRLLWAQLRPGRLRCLLRRRLAAGRDRPRLLLLGLAQGVVDELLDPELRSRRRRVRGRGGGDNRRRRRNRRCCAGGGLGRRPAEGGQEGAAGGAASGERAGRRRLRLHQPSGGGRASHPATPKNGVPSQAPEQIRPIPPRRFLETAA